MRLGCCNTMPQTGGPLTGGPVSCRFISSLSGVWESEIQAQQICCLVGAVSWFSVAVFSWSPHMVRGRSSPALCSLTAALIPFLRPHPYDLSSSHKAPPPNTIPLGSGSI